MGMLQLTTGKEIGQLFPFFPRSLWSSQNQNRTRLGDM